MSAYDITLRPRPRSAPSPAQRAARVGRFKINFLNRLIRQNAVIDLILLGPQLGSQDKLFRRLKVARLAVLQDVAAGESADLALSIDVIDRLTGGSEFNGYVRDLFGAARRYVVIHGSDAAPSWTAGGGGRRFTTHIANYFPAWRMAAHVPSPFNDASAGFFVFTRHDAGCVIPLIVAA